jgi:hypothetical protein
MISKRGIKIYRLVSQKHCKTQLKLKLKLKHNKMKKIITILVISRTNLILGNQTSLI